MTLCIANNLKLMKPLIYYLAIASLLIMQSIPLNAEAQTQQDDSVSVKERKPQKVKIHKHTIKYKDAYTIGLRTNLFRWATITPDLGIEWRIDKHWSVSMDASYSNWTWKKGYKHYGLWEIAPQARYYLGANNNWYAGIQVKGGQYNYKSSEIGHQGSFIGAGAIGGYKINLNRSFAIDFSLGLGYIYARNENYTWVDNVNVRKNIEDKHWWGPTSLGVSVIWMIQQPKAGHKAPKVKKAKAQK